VGRDSGGSAVGRRPIPRAGRLTVDGSEDGELLTSTWGLGVGFQKIRHGLLTGFLWTGKRKPFHIGKGGGLTQFAKKKHGRSSGLVNPTGGMGPAPIKSEGLAPDSLRIP